MGGWMDAVIDKKNDVQTLIPRTCEWVTFHGKKVFAGVIVSIAKW